MQFRKPAVLIVAGLIAAGSMAACTVEEPTDASAPKVQKALKKHSNKAEKADSGPTETLAQKNARGSAEGYLDGPMAFSKSGLIKQLKFEGFSKSDASYAVDAVSPNWNKQAAKSAESYLDGPMSFSRSGLAQQLEFEGYTAGQVEHALSAVGY